jgi:hypothetical protein
MGFNSLNGLPLTNFTSVNMNFLNLQAHNKLNDFNRIVLNAYVPEQVVALPSGAKGLLENKLNQIASNNGMGGSAFNPRFVIAVTVLETGKDIIAGPPVMTALTLQVTFYVADAIENRIYSNVQLEVKGVGDGNNTAKAYLDAMKKINVNHQNIKNLVAEAKNEIVDYYNTQCDFIIRDAVSLSKKGDYDASMVKLASIPDICESCYIKAMDTLQTVYQQKIDKECLLIMRDAKTTWMANPNDSGAAKVAQIINSISPFSTCEPDAGILMNEITKKLQAEKKALWEFQVQKHRDAVKLKQEAIRVDEEDRKKRLALQTEEQKQQYALQKAAQKQQYALQKADQEAGGLRGFVNSIAKLKVTLWRETAQDYVNTQKVDYSKLNFK